MSFRLGPETFELWYVRCISCNNVLSDKQVQFQTLKEKGLGDAEALDLLDITRECCRMNCLKPPIMAEGSRVPFPEGSNVTVLR